MSSSDASATSPGIPEKPALEGLEDKWGPVWEANGTYRFDRDAAAAAGPDSVFSVDTPPPTATGPRSYARLETPATVSEGDSEPAVRARRSQESPRSALLVALRPVRR